MKKQKDIYLSDRPPLSFSGKIMLAISYLVLSIWAIVILWPLTQMVLSAFNVEQSRYLTSGTNYRFGWDHFRYLFTQTKYLRWVFNTIFISVTTAFLTLLFVSFTGYAYSRFRFRGKKVSLMGIMLIQIIPTFVGITAFFALFTILKNAMPFLSRQMMLILIYSGGGIAGNTFILKGYMDSISKDLDDAAKIDGCSNMQTYRLIIMPIVRPMLAIIALWSFIGPFLDVILARILLTNSDEYTLAVGLYTLISDMRTLNQPAFAAGGLLTAIPIVIMFIALQNQLVSGLASGSVKG